MTGLRVWDRSGSVVQVSALRESKVQEQGAKVQGVLTLEDEDHDHPERLEDPHKDLDEPELVSVELGEGVQGVLTRDVEGRGRPVRLEDTHKDLDEPEHVIVAKRRQQSAPAT